MANRVRKLVENTEPVVQLLFNESYPERDMGPQGPGWRRALWYVRQQKGTH